MDFPQRMVALDEEFTAIAGDVWSMARPDLQPRDRSGHDDMHALGRKRSFVPVLGEIVWELPEETADRVPISAHVCRLADGRRIGYVRVPEYTRDRRVLVEFGELIGRFEETTEAMVLDQVDNPGGNMFQMYAILSHLTDRPLALPMHQVAIGDDDLARARKALGIDESGTAVSPAASLPPELVAYYRFLLSEFEAGRRPTDPVHLCGVAEILPAKNHYSKPLVVLINALTFSAPEFLAAILQDNRRASLFGQRTAGAGGCVKAIKPPGSELFGIDHITITWTLLWRTNGEPIENIGVHPDVSYSMTFEDLQSGYTGYRQALLATVEAAIDRHAP